MAQGGLKLGIGINPLLIYEESIIKRSIEIMYTTPLFKYSTFQIKFLKKQLELELERRRLLQQKVSNEHWMMFGSDTESEDLKVYSNEVISDY